MNPNLHPDEFAATDVEHFDRLGDKATAAAAQQASIEGHGEEFATHALDQMEARDTERVRSGHAEKLAHEQTRRGHSILEDRRKLMPREFEKKHGFPPSKAMENLGTRTPWG